MTGQPTEDLEAMLAEVRAERPARGFPRFDHAVARSIGSSILDTAERERLPVVVTVMRGPQCAFHAALDGTTAEHDDWVRRKVGTALLHEVPSLEFLLRQRISGRHPDWLDPKEYAVAGGAVPIDVGGNVVGVVAVSGIVGSMRGDHDLAMAGVRAARA